MKLIAALVSSSTASLSGGSLRALLRLALVLLTAVFVFAVGFQVVMAVEGRQYSWWAGVYWTVVTMSTLGFGDIVFESDLGRMYSLAVLLTGAVLILVLLPFTFIQLVYVPWRAATREARAPRRLADSVRGHVLVTGREPLEESLMHRARAAGLPYALIVEDVDEAVSLHDRGYQVLVGGLDDPDTYRAARADRAAMVVTARSDQANTNVAFTVREVTDAGLVVATANSADAVDVLELAGCDRVLQLGELLGQEFARRILLPTARSSAISTFEDLVIAEASTAGTALVGRTLAELDLHHRFGVSVVGVWNRGTLDSATADLRIEETSILLLAGRQEQLDAYDEEFADRHPHDGDGRPHSVVILGGGRVGRATARALRAAGTPCTIVERLEERVTRVGGYVVGDAADRDALRSAGIDEASAVVVTTHEDDTNIYLTLYCRRLRPDVEILGRVNVDRNLSTMHRAGADFVLSYASTGALAAWNALRGDSTLLLAEGLVVFRVEMPPALAGRPLATTDIRAATGCSVVGVVRDGTCVTDVDVHAPLPADGQLVLIGDESGEERFLRRYVTDRESAGVGRRVRQLIRGG